MGYAAEDLEVPLIQFVALYEGGEKIAMTTRGGKFVTLRQLREEVGNDAARFFYVSTGNNQHLDFDLDVARSKSNDNPVYYIQYAHARIASVLRTAEERGWSDWADGDVSLLQHPTELDLIRKMIQLPEVLTRAAQELAPHHLCYYAQDLASAFHTFYQECRIVSSEPGDEAITKARLKLSGAVRHVLANTLRIIGVGAPERM